MSRCFPFPPPGYEKKAVSEDVKLIIKEKKHKEKKHKDKKDKDKKERSDKKEKEKSEGKHKEDKDRRQKKHKDKKDKKKDKQQSSEEKKVVGSLENQNGEKFGPDSKPGDSIQDSRILVELGKRIRDDGETQSQMVQKITLIEQRKANLPRKVAENGGGVLAEAYDNIKDKRDHFGIYNGQSLKVEARGSENGMVGNFSGENQNNVEGGFCPVEKVEKRKERKEKNSDKNSGGKGDRNKNDNRDKNTKAEDKKRKKEKKKEKVKDRGKELVKQRETDGGFPDMANNKLSNLLKGSHDSQESPSKRKEPEMNGFPHVNGTRPDNMSRSTSFSRQVSQNGNGFNCSERNLAAEKGAVIFNQRVNGKLSSSVPAFKINRYTEPGKIANNFTPENGGAIINNHAVGNGLSPSQTVDIIRKVEPRQATSNVARTEQGVINNHKVGVEVPSSHPVGENGRKVVHQNGYNKEGAPIVDKVADRQELYRSHKMDNKAPGMNGLLDGKAHISLKPSSTSVKAKKKADSSVKSPHPDLKYFSKILTVPKLEWREFDDQDWLFEKNSQAKRAKVAPFQIESKKQVWAEAIHMESADITALPYVVPY